MQDAIILYENGKAIGGEGHPTDADDITFNNTGTDLDSENVEDAIKEVNEKTSKLDSDSIYIGQSAGGQASGTFTVEDMSDYRFINILFLSGSILMGSEIISYSLFKSLDHARLYVDNVEWELKYISDTSIQILYGSSVSTHRIAIHGIK